jgi:arginyl-tRNA synthetase
MDRMIYIVGNEQEYHFKVLFELFDILGYRFANQCHHLSYGMIELPDGKMKSREGNVIDADTLADELHTHSYKQLTERYPDRSDKQRHDQAESIAIGAITRYMLLPDPRNNFVFDPVASISFEGETGPYIQYTYARCATLLSKLNTNADPDHSSLSSDEHHAILLILAQRPETVRQAIDSYQPQLIARYTLSLAKATNKLYHSHTMISDNVGHSNAHHQLMHSITTVLSIALDIIGIDTLDTM